MISIGKLHSPDYYLREVVEGEDYYLAPGEAPGRWTGGGAALLGLSGVVDDQDLAAVFVGRHPRTDAPLTETGARLAGFDLTFSPAKSISLLWGLSGEGDARRVVDCLERAVGEVERYLEREACRVRRGHAGRLSEPAGGFVAAAFLHRTSRLADPGLHVHYLVHDLRHSYATAALAANVSAKVVSERLGHAKVGITLDVYSHVLPSMDEQAALTVARLILGDDGAPGK